MLSSVNDKNKSVFLVETDWLQADTIRRITIISPDVQMISGLGVGDKIGDFLKEFEILLPSMPDGYIGVLSKKNKSIIFLLDIKDNPELFYGIDSLSQIPQSIKIESIVLN